MNLKLRQCSAKWTENKHLPGRRQTKILRMADSGLNCRALKSTTSIEDGLNQCLPNLLECPVCLEKMSAPIRLCRNGHNTCSKCRPRLDNCPTCRQSFLLTRNVALETLAEQFMMESCGNRDVGCEVKKFCVQDVVDHMRECSYRLYDCEPGKPVGCSWLGRRWQILNHVQDTHKNTLVLIEENSCKIKNFHTYDHGLTTQLVVAFGELFWFHHEKDSSKSKFYAAVQYIGPMEEAEKYKYIFRFSCANSSGSELSFSRNTHMDTEIIDEVFKNEDCLCVSLRVLKHFVGDDEILRFNFSVALTDGKTSDS
ncbi:E3 ubiquitin-protein ligase SIAH1-like isoform X2 [Periplaneta americana]|uniref:E3 ubiquitin-protein ligase SIAH1-like isoform X2 n=1 Tax=Periplaneta americana TaxID=6978 RepID=UPI0037E7FBD9